MMVSVVMWVSRLASELDSEYSETSPLTSVLVTPKAALLPLRDMWSVASMAQLSALDRAKADVHSKASNKNLEFIFFRLY